MRARCFLPWCPNDAEEQIGVHSPMGTMTVDVCPQHAQMFREDQAWVRNHGGAVAGGAHLVGAEQATEAATSRDQGGHGPMHPDWTVAAQSVRPPRLGDEVLYRSRMGDYWLSATVSRTCRSSSPEALQRSLEAGLDFMEPLRLYEVDLTVRTPGGGRIEGVFGRQQWSGAYAEHCINHGIGDPGTWCYRDEVPGEMP